jgi:hypothetical protein
MGNCFSAPGRNEVPRQRRVKAATDRVLLMLDLRRTPPLP